MTAPTPNSRAVAARLVGEWLDREAFPDRLIASVESDRAFVMEMVYGVVKWKRLIEWVARECSGRTPDNAVMPFLLVGLYQVLLLDTVSDYAAVHETVEAVKSLRRNAAAGFVNAVLRRALRDKARLQEAIKALPAGIRESHPEILVDRWTRQYGEKGTLSLLQWNNRRPNIVIVPNRLKTSAADFLKTLRAAGVEAAPHPFRPDECIVLPHGDAVQDLPGYAEGLFSVQDPSTLSAVDLLDPRPGERILDACAAPGGKSILAAERMGNSGHIVAMDVHDDRLAAVKDNVRRLGLASVHPARGDASDEKDVKAAAGEKLFDRILLDVPCSNTGVLQRRPDARWRFSMKQLSGLVRLQRTLLDTVSRFLKPGGILVYSTCSLEPEESETLTAAWLREHPDFQSVRTVRLFPPSSGTDGVFAHALRRV